MPSNGIVPERERSCVLDAEAGSCQPELLGAAPGCLDHLRSNIGGEQRAVRLHAGQRQEAGLAAPRRDLEKLLSGPGVEKLHHSLGERRRGTREQLPLPFPSGRDPPPVLDGFGRARVYALTPSSCVPLNAGMMCSPYAASVSS